MVDYRLCNRIFPKQILIEKKSRFCNKPHGFFHLLRNIHWTDTRCRMISKQTNGWKVFSRYRWKVVYVRCTWYTTAEFWLISKFFFHIFSYLTLLFIYQGKTVKIILQNPPNHLKHQTDVSRGNFGKDRFP